jgi:predicted nucleic acid-binding protein
LTHGSVSAAHEAWLTAIADTNVMAYFLLATPAFYAESERFWNRTPLVAAPAHWQAEFANLIWIALRHKVITPRDVNEKLSLAELLPINSMEVAPLWRGALELSIASGVAVYNTLFVELATQQGCRLVTFDKGVLRAFPRVACRPDALD